MQRADYVNKLETMIEEGITNGKYVVTEDNTLKDLKSFQDFLTRNFKSSLPLNKVKPTSNQPAFLYGTAKTHKFQNSEQITKDNLKLRPIVSTCGTFYYETAKFLASYLLRLTENEYSIKTTTDFAERLSILKFRLMKPLTTSFMKFTPTINYHNSAQSYSSDACSVMSPRTQFSVLMASYINKSMDAAWATHYLQSLQTFSWLN